MAKNRIYVSLTDKQLEAVEEMQDYYLQENVTDVITSIILESYRNYRGITTYAGVGRPPRGFKNKKDERDGDVEELSIYDHPDQISQPGRMVTYSELKNWYLLKGLEVPQNLTPSTIE